MPIAAITTAAEAPKPITRLRFRNDTSAPLHGPGFVRSDGAGAPDATLAPMSPTPAVPPEMRTAILAWYDTRGRLLPFRVSRDPYAILVSEVMAQQTQIARVAGEWEAFLTIFPTVDRLAAASPADVLRAWRGLGYNRRALNLWRAARIVVDEHGGELPSDVAALERLPGVGPYTARAVAAIAFGTRVGAVDTNVRRVLGRVVAGDAAAMTAATLQALADSSVPADRPADWTHAVMDVGATFCRSRNPDCPSCPARNWCRYAASDAPAPAPATENGAGKPRPTGKRFAATSRWLRGRILDRLRDADGGAWVRLDGRIGDHDEAGVEEALRTLAAEGLLELHAVAARTARLPVA